MSDEALKAEFEGLTTEQVRTLRGQFTGRGRIARCDAEIARREAESKKLTSPNRLGTIYDPI